MLNKIKLGLVALLLPLLAFGQSYPSPTFNNLTVQGTFTATGKVTLASLATQAANTVIANVTGSTASPTAVALPSCSTANSAIQYTSGTGFSCGTTFALTGGTLAQFASTTSAQFAGVIPDETGSGVLVFGTNPTISGATITTGSINNTPIGATTANTGKFTTLQTTGAYTPSSTAGIVGTATNDNANAGSIGEFVTSTGTSVSLTTATNTNITSSSLTAGDWMVCGSITFNPAGSTTTSQTAAGFSTTSLTSPASPFQTITNYSVAAGFLTAYAIPCQRMSLSTTTTVFLVASSQFATSTMTATGVLMARRAR